jgi:hypothetical protein
MRLRFLGIALVAGGLLMTGCAADPSPPASSPTSGTGASASPSGQAADPNLAVASQQVAKMLVVVPVLPQAVELSHVPSNLPRFSEAIVRPDNLLSRTRWWSAPGDVAGAVAYLQSHVPSGLGLEEGGAGAPTVTYVGETNAAYSSARLHVDVVPYEGGVAVRARSEVLWQPKAGSGRPLPADIAAVEITVRRANKAPTVTRALLGAEARKLATLINALPVADPNTAVCSADLGLRDDLAFRTSSGSVKVSVKVGACGTVLLGGGINLTGADQLDAAVLEALGLPASYGR